MSARRGADLAAELAVLALTVVAAVGLTPLFTSSSFLADLLVVAAASHLLAIVTRRVGFGMALSMPVSLVGLAVVANIVFFPETAGTIVPTRETLGLLGTDLETAWTAFSEQAAPVEPLRGFVVVAAAAVWWIGILADWAAFRLRSTPETIAPATTLYVVGVLLDSGDHDLRITLAYVSAVAGVLLTQRLLGQARDEVWLGTGMATGVGTAARVGVVGAGIAIVIGMVAGPALPGAGEQLLDPSEWDNGPTTRRVTSPLVQVSANLVEQSRFEMFSVKVDNPAADRNYWRQMALTDFNGRTWSRSSSFQDARGPVGSTLDPDVPRRLVRQEITTRRLAGIYLPAAWEVATVMSSGAVDLEYEVETGALVVTRESERLAGAGFTYEIESAVPDYAPSDLPADASAGLDADFVAAQTALPPTCASGQTTADRCWPDAITALAEDITAGAATDFERVRLLQNHFLDPANFRYDLDVALRHDINSVEDFLFVVQAGYCEQFASTFAAMARSLGIPARVAVGFTWGDWDPARGEYVVRGEHAHAWPEVFFAGVGWIVLDPTPGRAPATNTDITGLAPAQLNENDQGNAGGAPLAPSTSLPELDPDSRPDQQPEPGPLSPEESVDPSVPGDDAAGTGAGLPFVPLAVGGFALVVLAGLVPASRAALRQRRLHRIAADPVARGEFAWDSAADALRMVGLTPDPAETPKEFARRATHASVAVGPVDTLADAVTLLRYADPVDPVPHAQAAQQASATIVEVVQGQVPRSRRTRDLFDPRTISNN